MNSFKKRLLVLLGILVLTLSAAGCADTESRAKGVYLLMDTSGTYKQELNKAKAIVNYLLGTLQPGDSLAVARIDSGSFSEKDIIAKVTFDRRPSVSNDQKRRFAREIDLFVKTARGAPYTDISGGLLQAVEFLTETGAGEKHVLIFSDLEEELAKGHIRDFSLPLTGFQVVALNVTKLRGDIVDPREYLKRLDIWRGRVEEGGGQWRVINDLERLDKLLNT